MSLLSSAQISPRMPNCLPLVLGVATLLGACQSTRCGEGFEGSNGRCFDPNAGGDCGPCGEHEFCDVSVEPNECRCAQGYQGDPCVFTELILDPGFRGLEDPNTGEPFWVSEPGGGNILPTAPGDPLQGDLGEADFERSVVCSGGDLLQVVEMPSADVADALVVEVHYKARNVHGVAVGFDRAWKRLPPTDDVWTTERFCLGEAGYGPSLRGGPVDVRIAASEPLPNCLEAEPNIRIDRFTIQPAEPSDGCLEPGGVLNGSAEPTGPEWAFTVEGNLESGISFGIGRNGTGGAQLRRAAGESGRATMTTRISVPLWVPTPALRFWWRGTSGGLFDVEIGTSVTLDDRGRQLDTLVGTGAQTNHLYCLPPWTHGSQLDLSFSLPNNTSAEERQLIVDSVEITSITSGNDCGSDTELLDPGFESSPIRWSAASLGSTQEAVIMLSDDAVARTGSGVLELSYWQTNASPAMEMYVLIPSNEGARGPALTFYSRSPGTLSNNVQWVLGQDEAERADIRTESNWEPNEVCLPPQWAGRWYRLRVEVVSPDAPEGPIDQERVYLDDFTLSTSGLCPTE